MRKLLTVVVVLLMLAVCVAVDHVRSLDVQVQPATVCKPHMMAIDSWEPATVSGGTLVTLHGCFTPDAQFTVVDNRPGGMVYPMQVVSLATTTARVVFPYGVPPTVTAEWMKQNPNRPKTSFAKAWYQRLGGNQ